MPSHFVTLFIFTKEKKMKKSAMAIALTVASLGMTAAQAGEFDGGYLGGKVGYNRSSPAASWTSNKFYPGLEVGYGWDMGNVLLGIDGFGDWHRKSITGRDYGVDVKLGLPMDKFMPYAKLGVAGSPPGTRPHGGLGIEYKFAPQWSVVGEWTGDGKTVNAQKRKNSNISVGVNYYFNTPVVAPVAVAPTAVKEEPKPEPKAAPAPAPKEAWKVIMEEKPVRIEGANFDTASAILKPTADAKLQQVVDFASKYPGANLEVSGYTDNRGKDAYNQKLSEKRAAAVKAHLVKKGIAAGRIAAKGYGKTMPVADNKTKEGRAANRRVEIRYTIREERKVRVQ